MQYILGNGFTYIGSNTQGVGTTTYNPTTRTITWNIGFMPKGGIAFMKIYTQAIERGNYTTDLTNIAKLASVDQTDAKSPNNEADYSITVPPAADIQVNQNYTTNTQNTTQYVTYTITVNNNGPDNATGVQITDKLPTGLQYISDTSNGTYNPTTGIWNIGTFNNGDTTKTLTITALITGTGTIKNTAAITTENQDNWNYNNNAQTTILTV